MLSEQKIRPDHRDRWAIVYVRQSTVHQVQHHQESTQLQYGLVDQAYRLGWSRERIQIIDDDLGVSGASLEGRHGFQRLLGDVALNRVGLILGIEMSRLRGVARTGTNCWNYPLVPHVDRRSRRTIRSDQLQRSAVARA